MKISAIIAAAGSSSRYGKKNKIIDLLNGKPVFLYSLEKLASIERIDEIIVCTSANIIDEINEICEKSGIIKPIKVILGGKVRQKSVYIGLKACNNPDIVVIHDGARPLIETETINKSIDDAILKGSSIVAVKTKDTVKKVDGNGKIIETPNRDELYNVQTPQTFNYQLILDAHEKFSEINATDDGMLLEATGHDVFITEGSYKNIKITTQEDILIAEILIKEEIF